MSCGKIHLAITNALHFPITPDLLDQFHIEHIIPTFPIKILWDEFISGFKKWSERTTTSPSGCHLVHIKVIVVPYLKDNGNISAKVLDIHHKMLNLTIQLGFYPKRWTKCISCAMEKDRSSSKLARLRIIHLYEADLNLMTKFLWGKKIVWNAEAHGALCDDQFGSRPYKACIDVVLQKCSHSCMYAKPILGS